MVHICITGPWRLVALTTNLPCLCLASLWKRIWKRIRKSWKRASTWRTTNTYWSYACNLTAYMRRNGCGRWHAWSAKVPEVCVETTAVVDTRKPPRNKRFLTHCVGHLTVRRFKEGKELEDVAHMSLEGMTMYVKNAMPQKPNVFVLRNLRGLV